MPKTATIKDIAKEAGVSVALVSFVMNNRLEADGKPKYRVAESTRQHILEVARRMNYRPVAKVLRREVRALVVGVILPDASAPYYGQFAARLEKLTLPEGCTLLFGYSQEDPVRQERLTDLFLSRKADALVVVPIPEEKELLDDIRRSGVPCVVPVQEEDPLAAAAECASRLLRLLQDQDNNIVINPLAR